eukprot:TRINITY_DN1526_c0_g1_i1.p2 TRINITY_DN1526_c0_g1~~TRINITY_DN1526_c0_g1_i1.p2  ORF type:complete len:106 (+),score=28.47 TRINITY_DN1526_c0_g1_i1:277-594(+)
MPREAHPDSDKAVAAVLAGEMTAKGAAAEFPNAGSHQNISKRVTGIKRKLEGVTPAPPTKSLPKSAQTGPVVTPRRTSKQVQRVNQFTAKQKLSLIHISEPTRPY